MKNILLMIFILVISQAHSLEKLKKDYLITYGDPLSSIQIFHYFSFLCPHCIDLFQKEFKEIKSKYLETNKVYWVFHPVPMDLLTVQAMDCLEKLTDRQKRIFLEAILEETALEDPKLSAFMMEKAMEVFKKPTPLLQDKEYISASNAFQDAFKFLSQTEKITAVPTVELNGELFMKEIPDGEFIENKLNKLVNNEK